MLPWKSVRSPAVPSAEPVAVADWVQNPLTCAENVLVANAVHTYQAWHCQTAVTDAVGAVAAYTVTLLALVPAVGSRPRLTANVAAAVLAIVPNASSFHPRPTGLGTSLSSHPP